MYAIEKDEAYLPEFKECVKEKIVEAQSIYPENHVKHFNFEGQEDGALTLAMTAMNLEELRHNDNIMMRKILKRIKSGTTGEEEPSGGAGGDGGDAEDGGDDDDE